MLSRPPALNETEERGRSLAAVGPPPALPLADEEDASETGVLSPPAPPWSCSSSFSPSASSPSVLSPPVPPPVDAPPFSHPPVAPPFFCSASSSPPISSPVFSPLSLSSPPVHSPPVFVCSAVTPLHPPPVFFTPHSPHSFSPLSSSSQTFSPPPSVRPSSHRPPLSVCSTFTPFSLSPPLPSSYPSPAPPPVSSSSFPPFSTSFPHVSPPSVSPLICTPSSSTPPLCLLFNPPPPSVAPYSSLQCPLSVRSTFSPLAPSLIRAPYRSPPAPFLAASPLVSLLPAPPPPPPVSSSAVFSPPPCPPSLTSSSTPSSPQDFSPPSVSSPLFSPPPLPFLTSCPQVFFTLPPQPLSPPDSPPSSFHGSPGSPPSSLHSSPPVSPPSSHHGSPTSSPNLPPILLSRPVSPPPPAPPPPRACCPCASLLPRLLSAHRLEVRRLLRGALASLGRRLDSLERRSSQRRNRQKRRRPRGEEGGATSSSPGSTDFTSSHTSSPSISHAHLPLGATSFSSSSSESEESPNQSGHRRRRRQSRGKEEEEEEEEGRERKRWRKSSRAGDCGRFVGQMAVSIQGGAEEEGPLTLHSINHRGAGQSQKAVSIVVRQNGYSLSSSQHALFLQSAQSDRPFSQSEGFNISSGQWRFSDFSPPPSLTSNHRAFHLWLCSSSSSSSPTLILRLSALSVETVVSVRGEGCSNPLRPLKDFTAPPTVSSDHCYIRAITPSLSSSARRQRQRANHSARSLHLPRRRAPPLPPCSTNGLSAALTTSQSAASSEYLSKKEERGKRVSQIRIRRASPRETPLTPMGLPKVKRLRKKEFSLEEIYTNKNYKSPSTNRSLETIFEEPREKDGALLLIGQQRRRRVLLFPDFTQPRKRKRPLGAGIPIATVPRKRAAARRHYHGNDDDGDLDVMLVERLSALEDFLTRQGLDDDV